jgi:predicted dehydrogenase
VEKPGARSAEELEPLLALASKRAVQVRVGFNHRFHPAARKAREIIDSGSCGQLMFMRARYGHGGRKGYDREWRADPALSGGGELIDQGVHLIDLARWYFGEEFADVRGRVATLFWDMPVDDNAFLTLATPSGKIAHLHASCTEWKNLFSFEIYGRAGKLHLEGLGGSYGVERLYHYQMRPEMGPPDAVIYEYPGPDTSWECEWADFRAALQGAHGHAATLEDARAALQVVGEAYLRCRS